MLALAELTLQFVALLAKLDTDGVGDSGYAAAVTPTRQIVK